MGLIIRILISAVAVWVAAYFIPGVSVTGGAGTYLIVAIVLGFLNAFIKPILTILTIPITISYTWAVFIGIECVDGLFDGLPDS